MVGFLVDSHIPGNWTSGVYIGRYMLFISNLKVVVVSFLHVLCDYYDAL